MHDFQAASTAQGKHYEHHVRFVLTQRGWTILNDRPVKVPGGEIDVLGLDPAGDLYWIECKGSYRNRPGLERLDTLLKAIGQAWAILALDPQRPPYMLITSNLPRIGTSGDRLWRLAVAEGLFDRIEVI